MTVFWKAFAWTAIPIVALSIVSTAAAAGEISGFLALAWFLPRLWSCWRLASSDHSDGCSLHERHKRESFRNP